MKKGTLIVTGKTYIENGLLLLRAGYTDYDKNKTKRKDRKFDDYYRFAKENNIKIGSYYESCALSIKEALEEVKFYLSLIENKKFDYPVSIKLCDEHSPIIYFHKSQKQLDKETLKNIVNSLFYEIKNSNYVPLIITYKDWYYDKLSDCTDINFLLEDKCDK